MIRVSRVRSMVGVNVYKPYAAASQTFIGTDDELL